MNKKKLYNYLKQNNYDYVVTTHLFAAQTLSAIKEEHPIHFMQVATDYVCIPFWKETNPDYFVIPSKDLEQDFINKGVSANKLLPLGIPVSKDYKQEYDKNICKQELNLKEDKKYVLILTGSMGFGNVEQMIKKLLEQIEDVIFIVSCGNNTNAVNNHVPVIPMVIKFREPKGIRKIFKKKKDVTLVILKPVEANEGYLNEKQNVEYLKNKVHKEMKDSLSV